MRVVFGAVLVGMLLATTAHATWSPWLSRSQYQTEFNRENAKHLYPKKVVAKEVGGAILFRGDFIPYPPGAFAFYTHHGLSDAEFAAKDKQHRSEGLRRIWHDRIVYRGRAYNQGVWVRY